MFTGVVLHQQGELRITRTDHVLVVETPTPHACLSFALHRGGDTVTSVVANHAVQSSELTIEVDALELLRARQVAHVGRDGVAMMTACALEHAVVAEAGEADALGPVRAVAVATTGLSNLLRVGDAPGALAPVDTINVIAWLSRPLTLSARIEALTIATEARTLAVHGAGLPSRRSGAHATGTGTDCVALLTPVTDSAASMGDAYAGKHTAVGAVLGRAVHACVAGGVASWVGRYGDDLQRAMQRHFGAHR
jgi:adenosylcobinamide amidohydrolase